MITVTTFDTPAGPFRVAEHDGVVIALAFDDHFDHLADKLGPHFGDDAWIEGRGVHADRIEAYLAGDLTAVDDIPVDLRGTDFQRRVWAALRTIPVGETWSYRDLAEAIGAPGAFRAVGSANGANPVSVIVPCHRVVRNDGNLGGYGGGLDRKRWLLEHEGAVLC